MKQDFVTDEEVLYRCVFYGRNLYQIQENTAEISSQAFADREMHPSVDRANLRDNNPCYSQKDEKDGVVSLIAQDVRLIDSVIQNNPQGKPEFIYKIDVLPRPVEENLAHAQIEPSPKYRNKTPFRKLLERLAYLANQRGWEIEPYELRQKKLM
jgi:hypothetical protein